MRAVPVPGEILRTTVFLGFTFDELVTLGTIPLVVVFPSLLIRAIPIWVPLILIAITSLFVLAVVVRTPEGQTPVEWAPAALKRRVTPDRYEIKPRARTRGEVVYLDRLQTECPDVDGDDDGRLPTVPPDHNASYR